MIIKNILLAFYTLICVLWLVACASPQPTCPPLEPGEVELAFETVDQDVYSKAIETDVFLISRLEDIQQLEDLLYEGALIQLANVDYDKFFAIAVFQGNKSSGGYRVTIERLSIQEHELSVCVIFLEPGARQGVTTEETSPYHLVKFPNEDLPDAPTVTLINLTTTR